MKPQALVRAVAPGWMIAIAIASGCSPSENTTGQDPDQGGPDYSADGGTGDDDPVAPSEFTVTLVPDGGTGVQRVNFAVPLPKGQLSDPAQIKVLAGSAELAAARQVLATYADGSARSVQIQVDVDVDADQQLTIQLGVAGSDELSFEPVEATLTGSGNNVHPKVWAVLPASVLTASGFAGPLIPQA
ncbi:MAG TPA: hypothetical protein VFS15_14695, partial [Kofleriaceae bacterium]|nr:hypothetical protein [Kofleriaceae bacterium]